MQSNHQSNNNSAESYNNEHVADDPNVNIADNFNVEIIKQYVNSITVDWTSIQYADVYKVEKYEKKANAWIKVAWLSNGPATIMDLDENFAYRFRIQALKYQSDLKKYLKVALSKEIVATTLPALPTTLCFHRAIRKGQKFLMKRLLQRRASLIEYPAPNGYLPLANAIVYGEMSIIDHLLTAGASAHNGNPWNRRTPLHVGNIAHLSTRCARIAYPFAVYSTTYLVCGALDTRPTKSAYILWSTFCRSLQLAFYHGRLPVARMLLNRKADLEAHDALGMSACHFAVDANRLEMLRYALENGANVETTDGCSWTLLLRAVVMHTDLDILQLLVLHGANLEAVDWLGQSCVDLARLYGNAEAESYLRKLLKRQEKNK